MKKTMQERFLKSTYLDKGTDLSASEFTKPEYQMWVSKHFPMPRSMESGFKSALGSAWHKACEVDNEAGTSKEFTNIVTFMGKTIGGTADELRWDYDKKIWVIGDHKTKGVFPAKKFLGIGTKAKPNPEPEQDKEILQLSIYRWMFQDMFKIDDVAVIYLWTVGHSPKDNAMGIPEYAEVEIPLIPIKNVEMIIKDKLNMAYGDTPPTKDCEDWLCNYCEYKDVCPFKLSTKQDHTKGFANLSEDEE